MAGPIIIFVFVAVGQAAALKSRIHGMAWASPIAPHRQLSLVRTQGSVSDCTNRHVVYQAAHQAVPDVIDGFYQDRLLAVHIKRRFPAQVTTHGDQTVYRWKDDALTIKLKIRETRREIKLGIYSSPLSNELHQAQTEDVPPGTFAPETPAVQFNGWSPLL